MNPVDHPHGGGDHRHVGTAGNNAGRGAPLACVVFRDPYRYKLHKETFIVIEGLLCGIIEGI